MEELFTSIKDKLKTLQEVGANMTEEEQVDLVVRLREIDKDTTRLLLLCLAIKLPTVRNY